MDYGEEKCNCLIALDLSAAFDVANYGILLSTLNYNFGIGGTALEWGQELPCT